MTYNFDLFTVTLFTGILILSSHLWALLLPQRAKTFLIAFPRSSFWGNFLLLLATCWCVVLLRTLDLGEFASLRNFMIFGVFIMAILTFIFVREFLAVRAFGILLLLAAEVLLCAAFLRPEFCRLFLVILAYGWIIAGMFFVGMPWILRDLIEFIVNNKFRFRSAAIAGISYGLILIFCAFLWIEAN